jgi:hypothetical protein
MAPDFFDSVPGNGEIALGRFLRLLDEGVEHDDHAATAKTKERPANPTAASGPEFKQALAEGLGVWQAQQGAMVFQQVQEFITTGQQVDRPRFDLLANTRTEVGKAK